MRTADFARSALGVCLSLSFAASTLPAADEWPQFRGPQGNGHAEAEALPLEWGESRNVAWKTAIPGRGHSSPVISDDRIWLTTALIEPLPLEVQKERLAKEPNPNGLEIAGELSLHAICVDRESGRILYDREVFHVAEPGPIHSLNSYASPTPVIHEGRVYCHFGTYGTVCLDAATGETLWENRELHVDHQNGPGGSPIVWRNLVIANFDGIDNQFVAAFDKQTGRVAWKAPRSGKMDERREFQKAYATPHVIEANGRTQLISPGADWIYSYDPATGRELWKASYGDLGFSTVPRPVVGHGMIYFATSYVQSQLIAVRYDGEGDVSATHVVWKSGRQMPKKPSPLLAGDELYVVSDGGVATCLDAHSGREHWVARLGGQYSASPLYASGRIYFFSQEGKTTVIEPGTEYRVLAENELDGGFMASPAVADEALFLRTETHLYRIEQD